MDRDIVQKGTGSPAGHGRNRLTAPNTSTIGVKQRTTSTARMRVHARNSGTSARAFTGAGARTVPAPPSTSPPPNRSSSQKWAMNRKQYTVGTGERQREMAGPANGTSATPRRQTEKSSQTMAMTPRAI